MWKDAVTGLSLWGCNSYSIHIRLLVQQLTKRQLYSRAKIKWDCDRTEKKINVGLKQLFLMGKGRSWVLTGVLACAMANNTIRIRLLVIRYDTIRYAILTCARKPTWVSLIYCTETTTKKCKTEKLKSKNDMLRSNSKSLRNHVVSPEEEKKGCSGKDLQKRKVLSLEWKRERVSDGKLIIIPVSHTCCMVLMWLIGLALS